MATYEELEAEEKRTKKAFEKWRTYGLKYGSRIRETWEELDAGEREAWIHAIREVV